MDLNQTNEPRFTDEEMAEVDRLQSDPSSEYYYNDPDESFMERLKRKLAPYGEDFKGFVEYLFTPSRHFGTGQYSEGGLEAQMSTSGLDAEGRRRRTDSSGKYKQRVEEGQEDIAKAASFLVPFYDSGVNIANVAQEYMKPEQERDYDYIKSQFTEAGQSAAIEGGLLLMGGVAGKYGAKGIKALADKVKQYEIDPTAMSAFGAGAIKKKSSLTLDDFGYIEDNPVTKGYGGSEDWLSGKIKEANKSKNLLDGATTAFLGTSKDKPLFLDTDVISSLKGARGEVRKKGEPQYDRLKKTVDKEGFDPNKTILIEVNHKGEAYIIEGNTRATLAKELGVPNIKAEIRYKNGAELVDSPFSPQNILEKSSTVRKFNKGGAVMDDQMEMAFMQEGGIIDDDLDVDPVSGNEVPPGSLAEEVRDDIPAQLSEGEYVVPADVVRYYGVKFFEDLRDQAKMGLAEMEANGRIGGEPVPDGGPVNDQELSPQEMQAIQEMMGMAEGGEVQNPYLQQQQLYSQPRPAPIDEKRNTTITNVNPVENQMPMQSMASGGQVQGYQEGNQVTQPDDDIPPFAKNEFNPAQFGLGYSFMGQQPQQKGTTTTQAPQGQTFTVLYHPDYATNGRSKTFYLPRDNEIYQDYLNNRGYTKQMPMTGPAGQGETPTTDTPVTTDLTGSTVTTGGGGSKTKVEADPNAWAENITDPMAWADENLGKEPDGPLDLFNLGQTVARTRALAIIAESEGNTDLAESLRSKARQVVEDNRALQFVPEGGMNGTSIASALLKDRNIVDTIFKTKTPEPVTAPVTSTSKGDSGISPALQAKVDKARTKISKERTKKTIDRIKKSGPKGEPVSATQKKNVKGSGTAFNKGGLMNKKGKK